MMSPIREEVKSLTLDLRAISELAQNTMGCLRSDLGSLNYQMPSELRAIMTNLSQTANLSYAPTLGDPELIKAIEIFQQKTNQAFSAPTTLVTSGGQAALFAALYSIIQNGAKVLTDQHYYPPYKSICQLINGHLLSLDLSNLDESQLAGVKLLLLSSPNNPTGRCYAAAELEMLAGLARKHDWIVVEDAVYNQIYFDEAPLTIATYCPERTLHINSVSKNFCVPGMRIGWITGESNLVLEIAKMHRNMNSCPNSFFQRVIAKFLPNSAPFFKELRTEMRARRDLMLDLFNELGWECIVPDGAIYIFVKIPDLFDSFAFVEDLIRNNKVSAMPGLLFGNHPNMIRFCYGSLTMEEIKELSQRLKN